MLLRRLHPWHFTVLALLLIAALPGRPVAHGPLYEQIDRVTARIDADPLDAPLYLRRAELYRLSGHPGDAERDLRRALEFGAEARDVSMGMALVLKDQQRLEEARELLDRLLEAHRDDEKALWLRATVLVELGQPLRSADDMDRALALTESPRPAQYIQRARLLADASDDPDRIERAIDGLDAGMARLGPVVTLQWLAIELEQRRGQLDRALERIDAIGEQYPRKAQLHCRRGEILEAFGRPFEAMVAYTEALDAIDALPAARRNTRMSQDLESAARQGLDRLKVGPAREKR